MTKTIVVTTPTGKIGSHVVHTLLREGHAVRAFVRSDANADTMRAMGAEPVRIDLEGAIPGEAFASAHAALLIAPVGETFEANARRLIDAAATVGVGRVVRVSIDSAFIEHGAILGRGHGAADAHLAASGLRHTILRPSGFMQNFLGMAPMIQSGVIVAPTGDGAVPFIDARDIADAAVAVLTDRTEIDGPVDVSGAEALTFAEIARRLTTLTGREVRHVSPAPKQAREGLRQAGFEGWLLDAMLDDTAHVAAGHGARVRDGVKRLTGRAPRTFDAFLAENAGAFRPMDSGAAV